MSTPDPAGRIQVTADPDIADLIPGFLENRQRDVTAIGEALAQEDFETIKFRAHSMKGAGAGYGFEAITDIGGAMEIAARDGNSGAVREQLDALAEYLERVEVIYE